MNTTPFGFAIVDKDGNGCGRFDQTRYWLHPYCAEMDTGFPHCAPHRIVELYTKEQLERKPLSESEIVRLMDGGIVCVAEAFEPELMVFARAIEAAHGIVESSSGEKGDV